MMETEMTEAEWYQMLRFFSKARDKFDKLGDKKLAQECDDVIAFAQFVANDPRL